MDEQDNSAAQAFLNETAGVPDTLQGPVAGAAAQTPQAIEPSLVLTPSMVQMVIEMPFNMLADNIGKDGEFWRLKELEAKNLGEAWTPVAQWLLNKWGLSQNGPFIMAAFMTFASLAPRLLQEKTRRALSTATTVTGKSGASPTSWDPLQVANQGRQTDSSPLPTGA